MITLGILVGCTSRGPVLFKQKRAARLAACLPSIKFRSMKIEREEAGPGHTKDGDLRLTLGGCCTAAVQTLTNCHKSTPS